MKPVISVVTGTFNRLPLLQKFMQSCRDSVPTGIPMDFIIVDGGSTDGTQDWCKTQPDVTLIEHGELLGAIKAFDDGAYAATGKYVLMANDDVEILGDSLTRALVHLEETPTCGGVAFYDDRPNPWVKGLHVWQMPAVWPRAYRPPTCMPNNPNDGVTVNYAQVGLFRKWLGDAVKWWGDLDPTFTAKTYAGDNLLSARCWELGYSIDKLDGVAIHDLVHEDDLRAINRGDPSTHEGMHPDSAAYYALYPNGPTIPPAPTLHNLDKTQLRILYLPIYEQDRLPTGEYTPRCQAQHEQRHGLRDALTRKGALVYEIDYLAYHHNKDALYAGLLQVLDLFQPHMLLMQCHSADVMTADTLVTIRQHCPRLFICNWNGDYWPEAQINSAMLRMMKQVDLALVVNVEPRVTEAYVRNGTPLAYWQIGYEQPEGVLPDVPKWDVLFLGSKYSAKRAEIGAFLLSLENIQIGLYGLNWEDAGQGDCTYDFLKGQALYRAATLTVADNQFPEASGFVSNRIFEALAAGGALMLHQKVKDLEALTGLVAGKHYVEWETYAELEQHIRHYLDPQNEKARKKIIKAGQKFVREHHSFDARVRELFTGSEGKTALIELARRKMTNTIALEYIGRADSAGGILVNGRNYVHEAGKPLVVDVLDAPAVLAQFPMLFRQMGAHVGDRVANAVEAMR